MTGNEGNGSQWDATHFLWEPSHCLWEPAHRTGREMWLSRGAQGSTPDILPLLTPPMPCIARTARLVLPAHPARGEGNAHHPPRPGPKSAPLPPLFSTDRLQPATTRRFNAAWTLQPACWHNQREDAAIIAQGEYARGKPALSAGVPAKENCGGRVASPGDALLQVPNETQQKTRVSTGRNATHDSRMA